VSGIHEDIETHAMLEPRGHAGGESKLERYWSAVADDGGALRRRRITKFDTAAGMTYSPMEYLTDRLYLPKTSPSDDWVKNAVGEFIRNEFPNLRSTEPPSVWAPRVVERVEIPDLFLDDFLTNSESMERIFPAAPKGGSDRDMAQAVYDLLCHPDVGSRRNARNNTPESFVCGLLDVIKDQSRLLFVLPGFPFKDQNRFRVPFGAHEPDLGEISFMIRLHRLTQALYQVHPFGADVVVLSDGSLYADIFGIEQTVVKTYMRRLVAYRNRLNLQGTVSFVPLKDLIDRSPLDNSGRSRAVTLTTHLEERLRILVAQDPNVRESFGTLQRGMKRNMETRTRLAHLSDESAWTVIRSDGSNLSGSLRDDWTTFDSLSSDAAFKYASVNLMLRWFELINGYFPGAIRGTVHPKPGQFALAGAGGAYAWNGVAWAREWPIGIDDIEIKPFSSLAEQKEVRQVVFESGSPAFYTGVRHD